MKSVDMTTEKWAEVPSNPKQRDTLSRAAKASKKHLKRYAAPHANVSAAQLPDGRMYKLDGHTRSHLWSSGSLEQPAMLRVDLYEVDSIQDVLSLYDMFDNASAAENSTDKLSGAYRFHDIYPKHRLVVKGGMTSAFQIIYGNNAVDIMLAVGEWKEEILAIDSVNLSPSNFTTALIAAALLGLRIYGEETLAFWEKFNNGLGERIEGVSDPVDALQRMIEKTRAEKKMAGRENNRTVSGKAYSAMKAYMDGRKYTTGIKETDITQVAAKARGVTPKK